MKDLWRMRNISRMICVAVFVFGVAFLFQAHLKASAGFVQTNQVDFSDTEPARSFVVNFVDSKVSSDGIVTQTGSTVRYVKANGEWRIELRGKNDQSPTAIYGRTSDGVFAKEKNGRRFVSSLDDSNIMQLYRSHNYLRNVRDFVRTDEVAGLKVYVFRTENTNTADPEEWLERSYSPVTGLTILKFVSHMRDGSEIRRDAVTVEFKDLPEDLNHDLKDVPIKPTK